MIQSKRFLYMKLKKLTTKWQVAILLKIPTARSIHRRNKIPSIQLLRDIYADDNRNRNSLGEYPSGSFEVKIDFQQDTVDIMFTGWAMIVIQYNRNMKRMTKFCLGVFQCPEPNCEYTVRPIVPHNTKRR